MTSSTSVSIITEHHCLACVKSLYQRDMCNSQPWPNPAGIKRKEHLGCWQRFLKTNRPCFTGTGFKQRAVLLLLSPLPVTHQSHHCALVATGGVTASFRCGIVMSEWDEKTVEAGSATVRKSIHSHFYLETGLCLRYYQVKSLCHVFMNIELIKPTQNPPQHSCYARNVIDYHKIEAYMRSTCSQFLNSTSSIKTCQSESPRYMRATYNSTPTDTCERVYRKEHHLTCAIQLSIVKQVSNSVEQKLILNAHDNYRDMIRLIST